TFSANAGESLVVRVGEVVSGSSLLPWLRLYGPNGALLGSSFGGFAAEVAVADTSAVTFLVVVGDGNAGFTGSGTYRLTLARTGVAVVISAGDECVTMTTSVMHYATTLHDALPIWTFSANAGESLVVRIGELVNSSSLTPWVRLYGPNGALLDSSFGG